MNECPIQFQCAIVDEANAVSDFLFSIGDEFNFADRVIAVEITDLLFKNGNIFVGKVGSDIVAVIGTFVGDPLNNYAEKELGFIYIAGLAKQYRRTTAFRTGLQFVMTEFQRFGLSQVQFHAREADMRLNAIYSKFARPLGVELNRRGDKCVRYGNAVEDVLAMLQQRPKHPHKQDPTPHAHASKVTAYHQ